MCRRDLQLGVVEWPTCKIKIDRVGAKSQGRSRDYPIMLGVWLNAILSRYVRGAEARILMSNVLDVKEELWSGKTL